MPNCWEQILLGCGGLNKNDTTGSEILILDHHGLALLGGVTLLK